ncbi:hypothetical protein Gotur_019754 [Gossypium turneri]
MTKRELRAKVAELERSFPRNRNSARKLRVSLSKIEDMKRRIEKLERVIQSCENRIEFLEASEERYNEQLHYF